VIVADTNLFVYLYVRGQRTGQAEAVLARDSSWAAPLLWRSEFRSTLVGLVRQRDLTLADAIVLVAEAEQWMAGREYSVVSTQVLELAARSGCSADDCEFVALAQDLHTPLVTIDRQVLKAFSGVALSPETFLAR